MEAFPADFCRDGLFRIVRDNREAVDECCRALRMQVYKAVLHEITERLAPAVFIHMQVEMRAEDSPYVVVLVGDSPLSVKRTLCNYCQKATGGRLKELTKIEEAAIRRLQNELADRFSTFAYYDHVSLKKHEPGESGYPTDIVGLEC
jgi:hypothetical protein